MLKRTVATLDPGKFWCEERDEELACAGYIYCLRRNPYFKQNKAMLYPRSSRSQPSKTGVHFGYAASIKDFFEKSNFQDVAMTVPGFEGSFDVCRLNLEANTDEKLMSVVILSRKITKFEALEMKDHPSIPVRKWYEAKVHGELEKQIEEYAQALQERKGKPVNRQKIWQNTAIFRSSDPNAATRQWCAVLPLHAVVLLERGDRSIHYASPSAIKLGVPWPTRPQLPDISQGDDKLIACRRT